MRSLTVALACLLVGLSLTRVSAQAPPPSLPIVTISPAAGSMTATHQVQGENFPANAFLLAVLLDPSGKETILRPQTDDKGAFSLTLTPGPEGWAEGQYRLAVGLEAGASTSATFTATDGQPHFYAGPASPSPTSAFNFVGTGLTPNASFTVHLWLTGGNLGERDFTVTTDVGGAFSLYVWPEEVGAPFFPAGLYRVALTEMGLSTTFWVREHPVGAAIDVPSPVQPSVSVPVTFAHYAPVRYLWGVYAGPNGKVGGEFLIGLTNGAGDASASLAFPDLGDGPYYIATPYDWGETSFTVVRPTPTATATATMTPLPTATASPTPTKKPAKTCKKDKHGRKHCKRR